jgi:hypothetical protein
MNQNSQRYVWCSSYPPSGKVAAIATERANADLSSLRDVKEGLNHCQIEYKVMTNEPELTEICMLPLIPLSHKVVAIATERVDADLSSLGGVEEGLKHCQIEYKIMTNEPELTEICMVSLIPPFWQSCCHHDRSRGRGPLVSSGR